MKKILYFILIICFISCESESLQTATENEQLIIQKATTEIKKDETVVIRFVAGLSETEKAVIRASYGVTSYEKCSCGDENLESWDLEEMYEGATIEERVSSMEQDPEMEGADFNFDINISSQVPVGVITGTSHNQNIVSQIRSQKATVSIGVLDTGINPKYFGFQEPFLHNSSLDNETCGNEFFGWNFVDNDNMPIDDNGHGTIVSYMIYKQLESTKTDFEILPAKAFDEQGKSTLFRVGCGLSYLIQKKVNIINMSFGWTTTSSSIIENYIKKAESKILMVTSAGNTGADNDEIKHFPSSYTARNILAVTAVDNEAIPNFVPELTNYGMVSVDIAVKGVGLPFYIAPETPPISVTGSSYSSAMAAGFSASIYQPGTSMSVYYHKILLNKIPASTLNQIKYASYLDL